MLDNKIVFREVKLRNHLGSEKVRVCHKVDKIKFGQLINCEVMLNVLLYIIFNVNTVAFLQTTYSEKFVKKT